MTVLISIVAGAAGGIVLRLVYRAHRRRQVLASSRTRITRPRASAIRKIASGGAKSSCPGSTSSTRRRSNGYSWWSTRTACIRCPREIGCSSTTWRCRGWA